MKCPKCGFVQADANDLCKKCGRDLVAFKEKLGIGASPLAMPAPKKSPPLPIPSRPGLDPDARRMAIEREQLEQERRRLRAERIELEAKRELEARRLEQEKQKQQQIQIEHEKEMLRLEQLRLETEKEKQRQKQIDRQRKEMEQKLREQQQELERQRAEEELVAKQFEETQKRIAQERENLEKQNKAREEMLARLEEEKKRIEEQKQARNQELEALTDERESLEEKARLEKERSEELAARIAEVNAQAEQLQQEKSPPAQDGRAIFSVGIPEKAAQFPKQDFPAEEEKEPYQPPEAVPKLVVRKQADASYDADSEEDSGLDVVVVPKAGMILRTLAGLVDLGLVGAGLFVFLLAGKFVSSWGAPPGAEIGLSVFLLQMVPVYILTVILAAGYFTYFYGSFGQTLGMRVFGMKVVDLDGNLPDYTRAFLRFVAGAFSLLLCMMGFFWIGLDLNKQGWHDKIARTVVIRML